MNNPITPIIETVETTIDETKQCFNCGGSMIRTGGTKHSIVKGYSCLRCNHTLKRINLDLNEKKRFKH